MNQLEVILKISLGPQPFADREDVRRGNVRIQFHIVVRSMPGVPGVAQQIMNLKRLRWIETELLQRQIDPS
ncbi:MAG: hypothetical protein KatS3mg105_3678 [Gemmatales bacterium]|nr:MAG: hypothetical protein KatS3mg105_3678 [Gemmatales bacterium]